PGKPGGYRGWAPPARQQEPPPIGMDVAVPPGTWARAWQPFAPWRGSKRPLESASFTTHGEPAVAPGARGQACKSGEIDGGEGYRKLGAQRQRAGGGWQAVRGDEGGEHPPGQGYAGDPPRHAPHCRWREDHRALSHHRPGRTRLLGGQDL